MEQHFCVTSRSEGARSKIVDLAPSSIRTPGRDTTMVRVAGVRGQRRRTCQHPRRARTNADVEVAPGSGQWPIHRSHTFCDAGWHTIFAREAG
jgi:hypothetical protein